MTTPRPRDVPAIRYFGTSWYDRGLAYWHRRFWLVMLAVLMLAVVMLAAGLLVSVVLDRVHSSTGRLIAITVVAIPIALSCYSAHRRLRRSPRDRAMHRPMSFTPRSPASVRAAGAAGTGVGALAAIGSLFVVGSALGIVAITLGRYVNDEEWEMALKYGIEDVGR